MKFSNKIATCCLLVLLTIFSNATFSQRPTALFSSVITSGCAPLLVNFSDNSTGNPNTWKWTLGNGTNSTLQNPSVLYMNPGQYQVKLVVSNSSGADSIVKTNYITVFAKPTVNFNSLLLGGCVPLTTSFNDLSIPGSGSIQSYQWDFGDGNFSTNSNPSHQYINEGSFNVSLLVTNTNGCSESLTKTNYITVTGKPIVNFTTTSLANCGTPFNVTFNNQSTGNGGLTFFWNFGDGTSSSQINPSHTYNSQGTFSVSLYVTNAYGCSDTLKKINLLSIANAHTMFTSSASVCSNTPVQINNSTTPTPSSTFWDFGDGTSSTDFNPVRTYTIPGIYYIKLVNDFGLCKDSMTTSIVVKTNPVVDFNGTSLSSCQAPLTSNFSNLSSNATTFQWLFGDGSTATSIDASHTFTSPGVYDITLIATSADGCSDKMIKNQFVNIVLPVASILDLPKKGCAPFSWTFQSSTNSTDSVVGYSWDFGDGTTSNQSSPTHIYTNRGVYDIKLIVTTSNGCSDTVMYTRGIKVGLVPHPNFIATPTITCAQLPVVFTDSTPMIDSVDQWLWSFGDGSVSTSQNPTHTYSDTGYMDVQLIVYDNGCSDTLLKEDYIRINAPIANFSTKVDCDNRLTRIFTDKSIAADSWLWDFGDGQTSTDQNPIHTYANSGSYLVTLIVGNNATGCTYTKTGNVLIVNQLADFVASDTSFCKGNATNFSVFNVTPAYYSSFNWNFGDITTGTGSPIAKIYFISGIYDVTLVTKDKNGCKDTIIKPQYIKVNGPIADFVATNTIVCSGVATTFSDLSLSDGRNPISKRVWNFGDGAIDTTTQINVSHTYSNAGMYTVSLLISDTSGCTNNIIKNNYITVSHPNANFSVTDSISCPNASVAFHNTTIGNITDFNWNFGDGLTSNIENPSHRFSNNGLFNVTLVVTNNIGCKDTLIKSNFINIVTPVAYFTVSDTVSNCPPLIVNFTNQSLHSIAQNWEFGDGNNSTSINPSHFYSISGDFYAKLTVKSPGGCKSSHQQKIVIHGPRGNFKYAGLLGCAPMKVNFTSTTVNTDTYIWDYNDGNTLVTTDSTASHVYTTAGKYLPKLLLKDSAGCVVPLIGKDTIHVHGLITNFNFLNQVLCDSGSVIFNNTTTTTDIISGYSWSFGDGTTSSLANPVHQYAATGNYTVSLVVNTNSGCNSSYSNSTPVKIVSSPKGKINKTSNGCEGVIITFNGELLTADTSSLTWSWNFGNGNTSIDKNPSSQKYATAGIYPIQLSITNSSGCKQLLSTMVEAYPYPRTEAGIDTFICKGRGTNLLASGADSYTWFPAVGLSCTNCANPIANGTSQTKYFVTGSTIHGCSTTDSINVSVINPFSMIATNKESLCKGSSKKLFASGAEKYSWTPSLGLDNSSSATPIATPLTTTLYRVIGSDIKNCFFDTAFVPVVVNNYPTVDLGEDKTINVGQSVELVGKLSSDVVDSRWSPTGGGIFRSDLSTMTVKPREKTVYKLQVVNAAGCKSSDEITVNVLCNGANLFIPNSFSPNNDGSNDIFYPRGTGLFSIKSLKIYTRWGEVVFEKNDFNANDASKGWDGTFKGKSLGNDVFVYIAEVMCDNNSVLTFKGNVAIIK